MTAVYLGAWSPGSPDWHAARAGRIGGSDIAAIVGLSPWESRFSLYHRRKGLIGPQDEKPEMTWGKRLEPAIVEAFQDGHPEFAVWHAPGAVYAHPVRSWQVASPDALLSGRGDASKATAGLEVKTDRFDDGWGTPGTDEIPPWYLPQVDWCMDVFGVDSWHVAFLCSGSDYREYVVRRDEQRAARLCEAAMAFLDDLEHNRRPDIDAHSETYVAVRNLHPQIDPTDVELSHEQARDYCEARHALKAAEAESQRQTSLIADAMGEAHYAKYLGQTIADRRAKNGGTPYVQAGRNLPTFTDSEDAA